VVVVVKPVGMNRRLEQGQRSRDHGCRADSVLGNS
jgi:hypothetical protein